MKTFSFFNHIINMSHHESIMAVGSEKQCKQGKEMMSQLLKAFKVLQLNQWESVECVEEGGFHIWAKASQSHLSKIDSS